MSCNDKISDRCVKKTNALCTNYEGTLSTQSQITASPCLNVEEVIEDINVQIEKIASEIDVHLLGNDTCLTYPKTDGVVTVQTSLLYLNTRIKELMTFVGMECDGSSSSDCPKVFKDNIACVGLNYGTLTSACGTQPTNLKEVLQLILNTIQP